MTLLLDSNVLVDYLRGRPEAVAAVTTVGESERKLAASVLSRTEVLAGMRPGEESGTRDLFAALHWHEVTIDIANRAGRLANRYARSHPGIEVVDFVIAATADESGAELWTLNVKHFPMFGDLEPPY